MEEDNIKLKKEVIKLNQSIASQKRKELFIKKEINSLKVNNQILNDKMKTYEQENFTFKKQINMNQNTIVQLTREKQMINKKNIRMQNNLNQKDKQIEIQEQTKKMIVHRTEILKTILDDKNKENLKLLKNKNYIDKEIKNLTTKFEEVIDDAKTKQVKLFFHILVLNVPVIIK